MRFGNKLWWFRIAGSTLFTILLFSLLMTLRLNGYLEQLELAAYDLNIRLRSEFSFTAPRIVLIEITEDDIKQLGQWPIPDATLAKVLRKLVRYNPRAIGVDIYRDLPVPPGHNELNSILRNNSHIITVMKFGSDGIPAPPVLKDTEQVGFNDILVDPGGIVRRGLLFLDDGARTLYSFPLRLALLYLQAQGIVPRPDSTNQHHIKLGQTTIRPFKYNDGGYIKADDRGYQFLIDYKDAHSSFQCFSLSSFLTGQIDSEEWKDKIVIIGVKARSVKDLFYTPYSSELREKQQISGLELHARVTSQILRFGLKNSSPIRVLSEWQESFWILLWGFIGCLLGLVVRNPWWFLIGSICGLFILGSATYFVFLYGWWIPVVPPAIIWLFSVAVITAYILKLEKLQRETLMRLFSRHVSPEVAELIWQERDRVFQEGRPRSRIATATVLFADLQGFTPVSEKMDPEDLIEWLNSYLGMMTEVVMQYGGIIDDYFGDGLKADFGVPFVRKEEAEVHQDALNAVNCALTMTREIKRLNERLNTQNQPTVGIRIGIYTGSVVVGGVGSARRLKYTALGDTVNVASRIERIAKDLPDVKTVNDPCVILLGDATMNYIGEDFETQKVGEFQLKGKTRKITVHRLIS